MRLLLLASLCACHPDSPEASVHGRAQTVVGADPVPPSLGSVWRGERPHGPLGEDRGSSEVPEVEPAPDGGDEGVYSVKDTGADPSGGFVFTEFTDVVVVGSGPAGISAAIAAESSGAHVIIFDRAERPAEGVVYAGLLFGVETRWQPSAGVTDTVATAMDEWRDMTGADGSSASVTAFLEGSAGTLDWLDSLGVSISALKDDPDAGSVDRLHDVDTVRARAALLSAFHGELRTRVEVHQPVVEGGEVVGVTWTDLDTGESGATHAGAVVLATGGFLRDRDRVDALRPELEGRTLLLETNPEADGGGLSFLDTVGAGSEQPDSFGLYVHAIQDPDFSDGEALVLRALDAALLVDSTGARFIDEGYARSLDLFDALPDDDVYAVFTDALGATMMAGRPAYNWADLSSPEWVSLTDLATSSDAVFLESTAGEVAEAAGIDAEGLEATITAVNALIDAGETDSLGRSWEGADRLEDSLWWAVKLTPGLAKAYGGVATDVGAHVLNEDGEIIRGLYAAGEVAGMIPGGGAGDGFSGTVSACYYAGRLAGANAATDALP